jgi:hypothetical protein
MDKLVLVNGNIRVNYNLRLDFAKIDNKQPTIIFQKNCIYYFVKAVNAHIILLNIFYRARPYNIVGIVMNT